jgi:predicted HAD superfamily Cof-like phosphohydrolase
VSSDSADAGPSAHRIPVDEQLRQQEQGRQRSNGRTRSVQDFLVDIAMFHEKYGLAYNGKPRVLPPELHAFRVLFMREEIDEHEEVQSFLFDETTKGPTFRDQGIILGGLEKQLDALVDEMYVVLGTAYQQGFFPMFEEAWRRVHNANMLKVRATNAVDSARGSTFDVIKPEGWTPPSHTDLIEDHAHRS